MWRQLLRYLAVHKFAAVIAESIIAVVCVLGDAVPVQMNSPLGQYYAIWFRNGFLAAFTF